MRGSITTARPGTEVKHIPLAGAATSSTHDRPDEGDVFTVERTFTKDDVRAFAAVSEDTQSRHTDPDQDGRLLVHGLLTATLPTEIGGNLEVLGDITCTNQDDDVVMTTSAEGRIYE